MKSEKRKILLISIILLLVSIVYTILVRTIDVKDIGPLSSKVGFASLNNYVEGLLPYNETFYKVSKYLGFLPFLFVGIYGLLGLIDLIKKKSFKKMEQRYLVLGLFYVIFAGLYLFFEKVIIRIINNYIYIIIRYETRSIIPINTYITCNMYLWNIFIS